MDATVVILLSELEGILQIKSRLFLVKKMFLALARLYLNAVVHLGSSVAPIKSFELLLPDLAGIPI